MTPHHAYLLVGHGYIQLTTPNPDFRADLSNLQGQVYGDIS